MADFPTLDSGVISSNGFSEQYTTYGDIISQTDAGYKISRSKYTRRPKKFTVPYIALSVADKVAVEAFIAGQGTTGNFTWAHPLTSAFHDVRLTSVPSITRDQIYWRMTCEFEEV